MKHSLTKKQQFEILEYLEDSTLPKPKWYESMVNSSFVINPNDFDIKEIEKYCYIDFHDPNFITFDGYGELFIKHETHKKWYCYFKNAGNTITIDIIPTEYDGEYIIFIDDIPKLVRESSTTCIINNDIEHLTKLFKLEQYCDETTDIVLQEYVSPNEIIEICNDNCWDYEFQDIGFEENWKIIATKDDIQLVFDGDYYFGGVIIKYKNIKNK